MSNDVTTVCDSTVIIFLLSPLLLLEASSKLVSFTRNFSFNNEELKFHKL